MQRSSQSKTKLSLHIWHGEECYLWTLWKSNTLWLVPSAAVSLFTKAVQTAVNISWPKQADRRNVGEKRCSWWRKYIIFLVRILLFHCSTGWCSSHLSMKRDRLHCHYKLMGKMTSIASHINVVLLFWTIDACVTMDPLIKKYIWIQIQQQTERDSLYIAKEKPNLFRPL